MVQPEETVEDRLLRASARLTRWASRHAELEVPLAQARVLALVEEMQPARIGELAVADQCSQPAMSAQLANVESRGWLSRVDDPADSRARLVSLTRDGTAALASARTARAKALRTALEGLDEAALQRLADAADVLDGVVSATLTPRTTVPA